MRYIYDESNPDTGLIAFALPVGESAATPAYQCNTVSDAIPSYATLSNDDDGIQMETGNEENALCDE